MELSLICNEELPPTPLPSRSNSPRSSTTPTGRNDASPSSLQLSRSYFPTPDDRDEAAAISIEKELSEIPAGEYVSRLRRSESLASLRLKALRWIISGCARMNYSCTTTFRAANYLDRFASVFCHKEWESWMTELSAVACLSIAAKIEEIVPASLQSLPLEDLDRSYDSRTIQRMELIVLKALDWRLSSVTSRSYVDMLTWRLEEILPSCLVGSLGTRVTGILLSALSEVEFVGYRPSIVAMAAFQLVIKELCPLKLDSIVSGVGHLIPEGGMSEVDTCKKKMGTMEMMEEEGVSTSTAQSPNTVIPKPRRRLELSSKSRSLDVLFEDEAENIGSDYPELRRCKKMKKTC